MRCDIVLIFFFEFYKHKKGLIEKTNNPQWDPKTLAEVTNQTVQSMFGPIDGGIKDLEL